MLCCVVCPSPATGLRSLSERRINVLQLSLDILTDPPPDTGVWNSLNDAQRAVLIDTLSRLIAKTMTATQIEEGNHD
jgi:hypothetical protein